MTQANTTVAATIQGSDKILEKATNQMMMNLQSQRHDEQKIMNKIAEAIQKEMVKLPKEMQKIEIRMENGYTFTHAFSANRAWMINVVAFGEINSVRQIGDVFKVMVDKKNPEFAQQKEVIKSFKQAMIALENSLENINFNHNIKHKVFIKTSSFSCESKILTGKKICGLF